MTESESHAEEAEPGDATDKNNAYRINLTNRRIPIGTYGGVRGQTIN